MSRARDFADLAGSADAGGITGRNLVINGAMQVAQRGTSHTTNGYGSLDRYLLALSGSTATMSQESFTVGQTDVPGSEKYLKCDVTTGDNNAGVYHYIEAASVFPAIGGKVTLSYYAKGTSPTDGLQVRVSWYDGSSGANATAETVTLTSSWVKYTHTFTTPDITGLSLTNASARLEISWLQKSTDTGTAAWELNLAQVQLEVGEQATPFEHRSYGDELQRCQRYFQTYVNPMLDGIVPNNASRVYDAGLIFQPEMRSAPVAYISNTGSSNGQGIYDGETSAYVTSLLSQGATQYGVELNFNVSTDLANYRPASFTGGGSTSNQTTYNFDAEL